MNVELFLTWLRQEVVLTSSSQLCADKTFTKVVLQKKKLLLVRCSALNFTPSFIFLGYLFQRGSSPWVVTDFFYCLCGEWRLLCVPMLSGNNRYMKRKCPKHLRNSSKWANSIPRFILDYILFCQFWDSVCIFCITEIIGTFNLVLFLFFCTPGKIFDVPTVIC